MNNVWDPLAAEIALIKRPDIQEFVKFALTVAPPYFWQDPASKSGKYHPTRSRAAGGIVHHTRLVVYFANSLVESMGCEAWRDEIIAAALLHDSFKNGDGTTKYGTNWAAHGQNLAGHLRRQAAWQQVSGEGPNSSVAPHIAKVLDLCARHMGKWSGTAPRPASMEDWCVHIADMIASRKLVNIDQFDENKVP